MSSGRQTEKSLANSEKRDSQAESEDLCFLSILKGVFKDKWRLQLSDGDWKGCRLKRRDTKQSS